MVDGVNGVNVETEKEEITVSEKFQVEIVRNPRKLTPEILAFLKFYLKKRFLISKKIILKNNS